MFNLTSVYHNTVVRVTADDAIAVWFRLFFRKVETQLQVLMSQLDPSRVNFFILLRLTILIEALQNTQWMELLCFVPYLSSEFWKIDGVQQDWKRREAPDRITHLILYG
jgi:hypothetical protein